jgi:hypothetical protein
MQLVIRRYREQKGASNFRINARMVLVKDETGLIEKYNLKNVALTEGNKQRDFLRALVLAIPVWAVFAIIMNLLLQFSPNNPDVRAGVSVWASLIVFIVAMYFIYQQIREEVRVNDLLTGRDFKAGSFIALLEKEFEIRKMSDVFAKVVDQSRTWEEPEVIELAPQPLFTILRGDSHATP